MKPLWHPRQRLYNAFKHAHWSWWEYSYLYYISHITCFFNQDIIYQYTLYFYWCKYLISFNKFPPTL